MLLVVAGEAPQPLLVVDDAALAYLAARGNRQVSTATQTLLPFSGVNPYIREKRGRIGREMFYGRDAERQSILDPRGTQVIFGGRGLGKSALLSDAGERFMEQRAGFHQYVYINLDQENIGKGSSLGPEALWSVLDRELAEIQVLGRQHGGRKSPRRDRSERVRAGIRSWLDGDSRRRLLILLDECDQFFEADAPRFDQTKKLKGLGSDTKDRAKVVFAGLHSVQRFSTLASNGPFGHLAQTPKVIGPLAPRFAADLLVEPTRALGFEFEDVDLVNRVLGFCSYQPFLLQMFGHRLVEVLHRKRARRGVETGRIDGWTLPAIGRPSVFKQELVGGQPRERRVIISDFARYPVKPETCRDTVELANTLLPTIPGVTRAVVLVTDMRRSGLWRSLLTGDQQVAAAPWCCAVTTVTACAAGHSAWARRSTRKNGWSGSAP